METQIRTEFTPETQDRKWVSCLVSPCRSRLFRNFLRLSGGLLAGLLLMVYPGCEQVVEVEWPEHEPQLVVNMLMESDSEIVAWANRSQGIQDTGDVKAVTDARLILRVDGIIADTLRHDSAGRYISPRGIVAESGRTYALEGSAPGLPSTSGSYTLPIAPSVVNLQYRDSAYLQGGVDYQGELVFELDDAPGVANYYTIALQLEYTIIEGTDTLHGSWVFGPESADPVLGSDVLGSGLICEDGTFDGTRKLFRLRISSGSSFSTDSMRLVVGQCSDSYYRYSQTMRSYMDASFNPFAEPVRVYSNMTAGMGIIGGVSKSWLDF